MLVDEFVEITVTNRNYKYLMDRGYEMPDEYKYINSKGNISLKFGFKILVYYFDLSESSRVKVRVKCDYPGCTDIHETEYRYYTKCNHDGITYCLKHANPVFHSGEKHPSYNPNKEHDNIRTTSEYAITKLNVHERDKYTCVSCGKKIYDPVFHHLYSVNTHKELACKIDNGVTLCKKCHKNFHNIYGYGNNTPAQFIDFIKRELDWLEDYDKTKVEKKLIYCAELDETSTKSYFSKKLDMPLNGICTTIDQNTYNKSVKGYHFISIQEKEKMKPEEFEKWINYTKLEFDFESLKDENGQPYNVYTLEDKISKRVRNKRNGNNSMLNPNEVLILNVLRYEYNFPRPLTKNGMSIKLLKQSLTYKKKCCISDKTIRNTLNTLIEKDFILENIGSRNTKYYKFNPIKTCIKNTIKISYMAIAMCICGNITKSELSLYILMRYLHNQKIKNGEQKGNCFCCSQSDLAKRFYGDSTSENRTHISVMIHNLVECHMLDIWKKNISKNNGWEYLYYRLNC